MEKSTASVVVEEIQVMDVVEQQQQEEEASLAIPTEDLASSQSPLHQEEPSQRPGSDEPPSIAEADAIVVSAKDCSTLYDPDTRDAISPGAVAVPGAHSTTHQMPYNAVQDEDESERVSSLMIVEATAVEEIIATQVVLEEQSSTPAAAAAEPTNRSTTTDASSNNPFENVTIEHVDIDNFETDPEHAPEDDMEQQRHEAKQSESISHEPPTHSYRMVILTVTVVLVCFVLTCLLIIELSPIEEVDPDRDFPTVSTCELEQQTTVMYLQKLQAIAYIELVLASAVAGTTVYQLLDFCQDTYCAAHENPYMPASGQPFYYTLIVVLLECLWLLFPAIGLLIWIGMHQLREPIRRLKKECDNVERDAVGTLDGYYVAAWARVPQLVFLLIARARLLFNSRSCQHISAFWRKFWSWLKIIVEVELSLLAVFTMFQMLQPVVDNVAELELPE